MVQTYTDKLSLAGLENASNVQLLATVMEGGINQIPVTHVDFLSDDTMLDLNALVGKNCTVTIESETKLKHIFTGLCMSAESKGLHLGNSRHYTAELRPWLSLLTLSRNNRIFQNKKAIDVVKEVIGEYGYSGSLKIDSTAQSGAQRVYCTQYRETDYDFVKRLLEEEGLYFYFVHSDGAVDMAITGSISSHSAPTDQHDYPFRTADNAGRIASVNAFGLKEQSFTQKVTLRDYNFETPTNRLQVETKTAETSSQYKKSEIYNYPGRYDTSGEGSKIADALLDAEETGFRTWRGQGDVVNLAPGRMFKIKDHDDAGTYMAARVQHSYRTAAEIGGTSLAGIVEQERIEQAFGRDEKTQVRVVFDAVAQATPFRIRPSVRRPEISGVQTAVVTGPKGDEQWVDKYGRIKVQFHWDRDGKEDENTTCWVRTMMPWSGDKYGAFFWPRIGQEVVIQFEEGNPDRPLCVGMLYNANNMPPLDLPGDQTRSGFISRSTKAGKGYNELIFEDKKGSEMIRMEAEKDLVQTVQNSAHHRVGYPHSNDAKKADTAKESMFVEIKQHLEEILEEGNHKFEVKDGTQTLKIKKDKTETIEGKSTRTVTGNLTQTVKQGNQAVKVSKGNYKLDTTAGKIDITAMQSITLKVGGNSIKIDQTGVTIKGMMVKIEGTAMLEAKAPMSTVKGDGMLILKGGLTMIN